MPLAPRYALFLQPHYDDVALSCGGTAAAWSAAGCAPSIVTVFASEVVHAMVGELAAHKHARWKLDDPDAVHAKRREEDARAAAVLGCGIRWLGLPDAIYRGDRYPDDGALYGPLHPEEVALATHLADELLELPEWRAGAQVFVPLGVGDHVDHQLAFEAGRQLAARGVEVWAYEDLPYGIHTPAALDRRLAQLVEVVGPAETVTVTDTLERKLAAIGAYGSQVPVIFRFTDDYRGAISGHARSLGSGGAAAERFWRVRGQPGTGVPPPAAA
ncbi:MULTISPECIES: PIG-L deacetylase family protein [Ramlibacter]|uniref:GlcNAc-PI de-N-acetylase n=1 Tax=Ramlibacter pinisoli TaxID=2682844 RepID=A0A6N8IQS1_9BURK|nr:MULTISPECIES: PIG-L family deacetylase [Ramlibacter]MBA2964232.1 PIG-L family deacetylase [Ramlibacter sp. CGMCC 1.13660]MVQ29198.1 GlcNAc-PI de-N-acetylase [Ramlibacter pinisoli]